MTDKRQKPGTLMVFMGQYPCRSRAPRRNGVVVNTPQGLFAYLHGHWHKMVMDRSKSHFDFQTGVSTTEYKFVKTTKQQCNRQEP